MDDQSSVANCVQVSCRRLVEAAQVDNVEVLECYIAQGCVLDPVCARANAVALIRAASNGCARFVQRMLDAGADPVGRLDPYEDTALGVAVRWRRTEVVETLLAHPAVGRFIDLTGGEGDSALECAAKMCHAGLVSKLLDAGAGANKGRNETNGKMKAAQMVADSLEAVPALETMLAFLAREPDRRAFLSSATADMPSLLHAAAGHGTAEMVRLILAQGVPVDLGGDLEDDQVTPFHVACRHASASTIAALTAAGADIHRFTGRGRSAFTLACTDPRAMTPRALRRPRVTDAQVDAVAELLALGLDPDAPDGNGDTARALASRQGRHDLLGLFNAYAARRAMVDIIGVQSGPAN